jgi:hypothetical protein
LELQTSSLKKHQLSKRCRNIQLANNQTDLVCLPVQEEEKESEIFVISMDQQLQVTCPHEECPFATTQCDKMRKHFRTRHPEDIIIIQEEGLLPQYPNCGIFQKNCLTERHTTSQQCKHYLKSKDKRRQERVQEAAKNVNFFVGPEEISRTSSFKYLGQIITCNADDLPAVEGQLKKARKTWAK